MNMTAATLHAEIGSARQKWPALLWIALLTALWIALTYSFPVIAASGAPSAASRLFIHILIALGLWLGLERTGLTPAQCVAGRDDTVHVVAGGYLGGGDQR